MFVLNDKSDISPAPPTNHPRAFVRACDQKQCDHRYTAVLISLRLICAGERDIVSSL